MKGLVFAGYSGLPQNVTLGLDLNFDGSLSDRPEGVGRNSLRRSAYTNFDARISLVQDRGIESDRTPPVIRYGDVGNALLRSLIAWARSVAEIEKITLNVRADNHRAIALYKKHGFVESGRAKAYLKMADGNYVDDITMELFVIQHEERS